MFILNPPYVSQLLIDTIKNFKYIVLRNSESEEKLKDYNGLIFESAAKQEITKSNFKLYTNSENSIEWIMKNMQGSDIPEKIDLFKNKAKFRNLLKPLFPNFYFREISLNELKNINYKELKYPVILKPAVGFLSFGVYPIKNAEDFLKVISNIDNDIEKFKDVFPSEVVNTSNFLIEEMIEGEEFAIDAYFNNIGEAVILNIFHHPFFDENDVSDRVYYTSKNIMKTYLTKFEFLLNEIGQLADLRNFPMHLELRVKENTMIPIEVNPMRFAGWCDTDVAFFAYGINIYEYYMEDKKPNWDKILEKKGNEMYYFTGADIPSYINNKNIKSVDYEKYLSNIKHPLDVRKIDYKIKPLFAVVIGRAEDSEEIKTLLNMDLSKFIQL